MPYATDQLIEILEAELKATWRGERLLPSSMQRLEHPAIAHMLGTEKLSRCYAYRDFREQIHQYQREHQVSGIIWRSCTFQKRVICYPELHNQLVAIEGDRDILLEGKHQVLTFWREVTADMPLWSHSLPPEPMTSEAVEQLADRAEWVEIDATRTELYLGLCWGDLREYQFPHARPASGCDRVIAAHHQPIPIKI